MGCGLCSEGEDEVVREHDPLGRDVELFNRHLYIDGKPKPTSKGVVGVELVDGLVIQEGDYKLVKTRFSALFNTSLYSYLQEIGVTNLVTVDSTAVATPDIHIGMYSQALHQALQVRRTTRQGLEYLFRYFDDDNLWLSESGIVVPVLKEMQYTMDASGGFSSFTCIAKYLIFLNEERTLWEATNTYVEMSTFISANKIKNTILIIHREEDNNLGTLTMQAWRTVATPFNSVGVPQIVNNIFFPS
ncbi:hypothetical protein FXO38_35433 [Capsicum annuum]|uniref:Uncharacterized protein n=1 Tax=Capsicum annuum TaxID=4072 RepID=A0A2G2YT41_CAPAN|nr:hypothetical protein FXO38_35433 [Capsicum annuum]KAF3624765.1 hypothetical protein FXO37_31213 [Capsicum annuum]PHT72854.1 hypothetical protein T459_23639 [Capsicum annuum]